MGSRLGEINQEIDQLRHMPEELPSTSMNDSDDSRLLADLSPLDVGGGIDQFLPFREAVGARIAAAQEGHLTPVAALRGLGRRVTRGLKSSVGRSARRMIPSLITK